MTAFILGMVTTWASNSMTTDSPCIFSFGDGSDFITSHLYFTNLASFGRLVDASRKFLAISELSSSCVWHQPKVQARYNNFTVTPDRRRDHRETSSTNILPMYKRIISCERDSRLGTEYDLSC